MTNSFLENLHLRNESSPLRETIGDFGNNNFVIKSTIGDSQNKKIFTSNSQTRVFSNPILIDGNYDFMSQADLRGWPGNGTISNPYIINGYNITGSSDLINIQNTDIFFQIKNCLLSGVSKSGILFNNVSNSHVSLNRINNKGYGIRLRYSDTNSIIKNSICNNTDTGIRLLFSENTNISENIIYENSYGINLWESFNNYVSNNIVFNSTNEGIYIGSSWSNTIFSNEIHDNRYGIYLTSASTNTVMWNNFWNNINHGSSQAYDNGGNHFSWNYWADWTQPDNNHDGIVDIPYSIDGDNQDQYPVVYPYQIRSFQEGGLVAPGIFIYSTDSTGAYYRDKYNNETKAILENLGFRVIVEDRSTIPALNNTSFINISQFWIMNGGDGSTFTESEKNLILDAWRNGTDIVLAGDETGWHTNVNLVGENFGVEYEGAYLLSDPQIPNFTNHPIWINVSTLYANPVQPQLIIGQNSTAQALSTDSGYYQHVLFENETGKVFWGSSFGNFMDEHISKYDNAQYISNLVRYIQEPEIRLIGANNNSDITIQDQIRLEIVDDNLLNVSYNWNGAQNQSIEEPFDIPLPTEKGWKILNVFAKDKWNHTIDCIYNLFMNHSAIYIYNDYDFKRLGFSGEGTLNNPFFIENFNITSSNSTLIHIQDTTAYFIIRNNSLKGLNGNMAGIHLISVTNGLISDNFIYNSWSSGIRLENSNDNIVSDNIIQNSSNFGILLSSSSNNNILSGNTIFNHSDHGIYLSSSDNNTISDNNVFDCAGIYTLFSSNNIFSNNTIRNSTNGINLSSSSNNNSLYDNTIANNPFRGIFLQAFSSNNTVSRNTISTNSNHGIYLSSSATNNNVTGNYFFGNNPSGSSQAFDDVSGNLFDYNYWDNWTSPDANFDEIVDNPYAIDGTAVNYDYHPLVGPFMPRAPSITLFSPLNNTLQEYGTSIVFVMEDDNLDTTWYAWDDGVNQSFTVSWNLTLALVDGWHWLTVYANDTACRLSIMRYYFYCEADEPVISLVGTVNDTVLDFDYIIYLIVTDYSLDKVWYNWDGTDNQTLTGQYKVTVPTSEAFHWLSFYANDSVGHLNVHKYRWWINHVPTCSLSTPSNNSIQLTGTTIVLEIKDNNLDDAWYAWDDGVNQSFTVSWNLTLALVDGWHSLVVYANDTAGELTQQLYSFYCEAAFPVISLVGLENDTLISSETTIRLKITDFSLQNVLINWDDEINQTLISSFDVSVPVTEGYHWLNIYANDSVGHLMSKKFRWWINLVPTISLLKPTNDTVQKYGTTAFLAIADNNLDVTWFSLDNNDNQSFSVIWNVTLALDEGWHWLRVYANDTYGETTIRTYHFYCDGTAPVIGLIGMQNDSVISSTDGFQLDVTDFLLETVWFNWDDSSNQTLDSSYEITVPLPEGYHWLTVYAIDSVGHLSRKNYRFFVNYPPVIQLQNPSNSSAILPTTEIEFSIIDISLLTVWYQWDSEGNVIINDPFVALPINESDWHTLIIRANDSWGSITTKKFLFYILGSATVETTQLPPSTAYDGESFIFSFEITNPESVFLNLTLFVYGDDDTIQQGNGSQIILAPNESQIIILEIKPKHASIHQVIINIIHKEEVYHQYTLVFDVKPQWQSPRFYIPFSILLFSVFLLILSLFGILTYFSRSKKEHSQPFMIEEFTPISSPSLIKRIQIFFKARALYKRARGTLHLQTLKICSKNMKRYVKAQESQKTQLISSLQSVERQEQRALEEALSKYLVSERLTEAEGIGSVLQERINASGRFRHINDLHNAIRYVYGIGEVKQEGISQWVRYYRRQFPQLLQGPFPGKNRIVSQSQQRKTEIQGQISTIDNEFVRIHTLADKVKRELNWLQEIKPKHFRGLLQGKYIATERVKHYISGIFPELISPPDWFDNTVLEFGKSQYNKILKSQYRGFTSTEEWENARDEGFTNKTEFDGIKKKGFQTKFDYNSAIQLGFSKATDFYASYATVKEKIIDKERLSEKIIQIIAKSHHPVKISDLSNEFNVNTEILLSILQKTLSNLQTNGQIIENVYYPDGFIDQISFHIFNQGTGSLTSVFSKFRINQAIFELAIQRLLESEQSIFTIYLNPDQDIFVIIYHSEWNNIIRKLSSSEGVPLGVIFPEFTIYNWKGIFESQKLIIFLHNDRFFNIDGLQAFAINNLDEIDHIIKNIRRQLPQLPLNSQSQREILKTFELLVPIEPVLLPYYCQLDSSMIVKEQSVYVCSDCDRKICPTCYREMRHTGMENCIHCGGDLIKRPALQMEVEIERVDRMSGHEFENFLEGLFRTQMYRVENIQSSGDHGVDLVVVKGEIRTGVQAKRFKPSSKIGSQVLVTLKGGGYFHDCEKLMVVTTSYFTPKAKEYAQKVGIELWDRDVLRRYLTKYNQHLQDLSK